MVAWLSQEWVEASGKVLAGASGSASGEPGAPSPSTESGAASGEADTAGGLVVVEVTGTDGGWYWRRWAGGVPVAGGAGKPDDVADLTLGLTVDQARAHWRGEWPLSVAFMRGQLKAAGDMALLFTLLSASARPGYAEVSRAVEALGVEA